jgi:hypothetical protein
MTFGNPAAISGGGAGCGVAVVMGKKQERLLAGDN